MTQVYEVRPQSFKRGSSRQAPRKRNNNVIPDPRVPLLFVTSFSPAGYKDYGRRFLEGFIEHWPGDCLLAVFHEGERPELDDDRIWYFDLRKDNELGDFLLRNGGDPKKRGVLNGGRDFRWDAIRFAPKVFALTNPILPTSSWRIWIDADVETTGDIPDSFFSKLLRTDATAVYLGRPKQVFKTSECGFVAYRANSAAGRQFLADMRLNYTTGKIFDMPEWHDSFVFDALRMAYQDVGVKFHDLAAEWYSSVRHELLHFDRHGHPWPHTKLGQYLTHHKGPAGKEDAILAGPAKPEHIDLKRLCADPSLKNRYQQIGRILSVMPHKNIVEVGVANGRSGLAMCRINLEKGEPVNYVGFDLFEDITEETSANELNAKEPATLESVKEKFEALKQEFPGLLTYELVKGNSRETLPKRKWDEDIDVAFIDGGHSIETIESDYNALKDRTKLILLDDYYVAGPDIERFGCNKLVEKLSSKIRLPYTDKFDNGNEIQIVATGPILSKPGQPQEIRIKTKNCVPDEEIQANIRNAARYTKTGLEAHVRELQEKHRNNPEALLGDMKDLDPGFHATFLPGVLRPTDIPVLFVGGSPTITDPKDKDYQSNWAKVKELSATHRVVVCKTSYGTAFKEGVLPWACFLLDPRDHVADWLNPPDCRVLWLVASMCHPSTWAHIARPGFQVLGYHAGVGAGESEVITNYFGDSPIVHGGTTSSFRGLSLLYNLGFRHFKTIGLDSSYPEKPEKPHGRSVKPVQNVTIGKEYGMERSFWTDPELIAQSQDAEFLAKLHPSLDIEYLGDGLLQHAQRCWIEKVNQTDVLDPRPTEHRLGTWFNLYKSKAHMAEALFIHDVLPVLQMRAGLLSEMLGKERTFDEVVGGAGLNSESGV